MGVTKKGTQASARPASKGSGIPSTGPLCDPCREKHLKCDRATPVCGRCASTGRECRQKSVGWKRANHDIKSKPTFSPQQRWVWISPKIGFRELTEITARSYNDSSSAGDFARRFSLAVQELESSLEDSKIEDSSSIDEAKEVALRPYRRPDFPPTPTTATAPRRLSGLAPIATPSPAQSSEATLAEPPTWSSASASASTPADTTSTAPTSAVFGPAPSAEWSPASVQASPSYPPQASPASAVRCLQQPARVRAASPSDRFIAVESPYDRMIAHHVWPLRNALEAMLFQHYVRNLAVWLDLCDRNRSFQTVVPGRAETCPILLNAILALAARHLNRTGKGIDDIPAREYHDVCLRHLLDQIKRVEMLKDENLFAAAVIMRVLEEIEEGGHDSVKLYAYMLSIHKFVERGDWIAPRSLSAAAYWVGLRQEIYVAVIKQQSVRMNLALPILDRSLAEADDETWANRAVTYCADVLNFCHGGEKAGSQGQAGSATEGNRWAELTHRGNLWESLLPRTCKPFFESERAHDNPFPRIQYSNPCHVIGIQHHILAVLFLAAFKPGLPRVGWPRVEAQKEMTDEIQHLLKRLCGIGLSNSWSPPALFTACMGIAACLVTRRVLVGDRINDRNDQDAFLDILDRTEKDHARPTHTVKMKMLEVWGRRTSPRWPARETATGMQAAHR